MTIELPLSSVENADLFIAGKTFLAFAKEATALESVPAVAELVTKLAEACSQEAERRVIRLEAIREGIAMPEEPSNAPVRLEMAEEMPLEDVEAFGKCIQRLTAALEDGERQYPGALRLWRGLALDIGEEWARRVRIAQRKADTALFN